MQACPYRRCARSTGHVADPCSHVPLSDGAQHAVPSGSPHMTHRNHAQCDGVVPLARHAGARFPILRVESSSEDRLEFEGDQAEKPAADRQGQKRTDHLGVRKWQRVPGRRADRLCTSRVFPVGCVPGATGGSMPVGSARFRDHAQDSYRVLGMSFSSSLLLMYSPVLLAEERMSRVVSIALERETHFYLSPAVEPASHRRKD